MEDTSDPVASSTSSQMGREVLRPIWQELRDETIAKLEETSIEDLCQRARDSGVDVGNQHIEVDFCDLIGRASMASLQDSKDPGIEWICGSILETIGNTLLVRLSRLADAVGINAENLAKLEFFNPLGSVKDRIRLAIIEALEREGWITDKTVLIEPTLGGAALAAAVELCERTEMNGRRVVVIIPSFAERYLSTPLFDKL
jgi:hypothetical protein